ncbi:MAG: DNA polymerase [Thermoplasmata archaeon]
MINIIQASNFSHEFNKVISFDSESIREKTKLKDVKEIQSFYNCDFYDGNKHYYTENANDILNIIEDLKTEYRKITIIAHNWKYDLRISGLLNYVLKDTFLNLENTIRILDNIIYISFQSRNHNYQINFLDTLNYFHSSLHKLAEMYNLHKEKMDEYNLEPDLWNKILRLSGKSRVQKDTELLYMVFENFLKMNFNYGISIASTSFNTFKNKFLNDKITYDLELNPIIDQLYRGGICYQYRKANLEDLKVLDINSLYPYVMSNNYYSIKFHKDVEKSEFDNIYEDQLNNSYNYILNVDYIGEKRNPILTKYDNKLITFSQNKNQWITGKEYIALIDNGYSVIINEAKEFHSKNIFKEFIEYYYKLRLENKQNDGMSYFLKILMNSLYGKFGQHKGHSELIEIDKLDDNVRAIVLFNQDKDRITVNGKAYSIYDNFVSVMSTGEIKYNPIISSEITANARLINYDYQKMIGLENIYYTDTDSFFVLKNLAIPEILIGNELGKLKVEKQGIFTIYGNKDYFYYSQFGDNFMTGIKTTNKGIPSNSEYIGENKYRIERFDTLKTKHNRNQVYVNVIEKSLAREYSKSIPTDDYFIQFKDINDYELRKELLINEKRLK